MLGLSLAGKLRKYVRYYKNRSNVFDATRVNCSVSEWKDGGKEVYTFSAYCWCNDALITPATSNWLCIYNSKQYTTRQETEANLELEIIDASKQFKDTSFYKARYYPEHGAVGESLLCKNGIWGVGEDETRFICAGCGCRFSAMPKNSICPQCGEIIT